jgi:thiol-disulfide isomerase/thioredoxin
MVGLNACALALLLAGAGETVLLDFSADWCGPCRSMEPTIQRLAAEGYPIRKINIGQDPQAASQYGVTGVPCFVMLANGQEMDRVVGAASHARLRQMFAAAGYQAQANVPISPASTATAPTLPDLSRQQMPTARTPQPTSHREITHGSMDKRQQALQATVRLRVHDARGHSMGTGTVIDRHDSEALVVTCGHIFRDAGKQGRIEVDVFAGGTTRTVPGQLISYDLKRDIGLVSIVLDMQMAPMRVAPGGHSIVVGQPVFSVGCDRGRDPTVQQSQITAIDKYLGPPNIEVAGQPVDGRSGGGLFTQDGFLIGVCNAADPADGEGIFAALPTVHWELDRIGQRRIYEPATPEVAPRTPDPREIAAENQAPPITPITYGPGSIPREMPTNDVVRLSANDSATLTAEDMEVICIVRPRHAAGGQEKLIIFREPSQSLLNLLAQEPPREGPEMGIALQTVNESTSPAVWPNRHADGDPDNGVRAQSAQ